MADNSIGNDKAAIKRALEMLALSEDTVYTKAVMLMHPIRLLETLVYLGEAMNSVKELRRDELSVSDRRMSPEHLPTLEAVHKAYDSTEEAFDVMLDACAELIIMTEFCQCPRCQVRRQRQNADLS